ncbi:hypothetical protein BUE80_DR006140 [Diplocarpon rosae]|nr:hypothetical protein BUE80_DR006140 [Diplocarpon rosae]
MTRLLAASTQKYTPRHTRRREKTAQPHHHINIISSPEIEYRERMPDTFVRKASLQDEIDVGLAIFKLDRASSSSAEISSRPRTFAEATMATRPHRRNGSSLNDTDLSEDGSFTTTTKVTFKKKKRAPKWQPLDLSDSNENLDDEADNEGGEEATSAAVSSAPTRSSSPVPAARLRSNSPPTDSCSFLTAKTSISRPTSEEGSVTLEFKGKRRAVEELGASAQSVSWEDLVDSTGTPLEEEEGTLPLTSSTHDSVTPQVLDCPPIHNNPTPTQANHGTFAFGKNGYIEEDNDPTPRVSQTQFPGPFSYIQLSPTDQGSFGDDEDYIRSDTDSTKARTQAALYRLRSAIMAGKGRDVTLNDDVFGSEEWDPELPSAPSPTDSPELVAIKPKPVAYTTVGSLVDPKAVPQFTAPNRIQREGANRRPVPLSLLQSRQFEGGFFGQQSPRGPPPPLNMSSSMQYAQQIGRQFTKVDSQGNVSSPSTSSVFSSQLTEQEMDIITKNFGGPELHSGNAEATHSFMVTTTAGVENRNPFLVKDMLDDNRGRSNSFQGSMQGMEKMQTLQRLARFDNPMQEVARTRLAELSLKSQVMGKTVGNPNGLTPFEMTLQGPKSSALSTVTELSSKSQSEINRGYQFPPPGLATPQANPLLAALQNPNGSQQNMPPSRRAGYPQPLTAGPPGQRQFFTSSSQLGGATQVLQQVQNGNHSNIGGELEWSFLKNLGNSNLESDAAPLNMVPNKSYPSTKIFDTISREYALAQYYPHGLPADWNDDWAPVTEENLKFMGMNAQSKMDAAQLTADRKKENDDWFYQGQRRFATMSIEDHIVESSRLEDRQPNTNTTPWGTIGPPKQILHAVIPKKVSIEDVSKMPVGETIGPILSAAFGTLLAYAENGPTSRSHLSRFVTPAAHLVDTSPTGNDTSLGEDWGDPNFKSQDTKPASFNAFNSANSLDTLRESGSTRRVAFPGGNGKWYGK